MKKWFTETQIIDFSEVGARWGRRGGSTGGGTGKVLIPLAKRAAAAVMRKQTSVSVRRACRLGGDVACGTGLLSQGGSE